jgi:hypothetical protein
MLGLTPSILVAHFGYLLRRRAPLEKPRISRDGFFWWCRSASAYGYGLSPFQAYQHWKMRMKLALEK